MFFRRFQIFTSRRTTKKRTAYSSHKEEARALIHNRLEYFASKHAFAYKRVAIRDTRRSWGSCSSKGNLNFSYKLLFLPACLRDYIIVHELCHLRQLNHGPLFWQQVAMILPEYKIQMNALRSLERTRGTSIKALQKLKKESDTERVYIPFVKLTLHAKIAG